MAAYTPITAGTPILHAIHPIPSHSSYCAQKNRVCKKSEVRVTRSRNVERFAQLMAKNGTAVERAYYEHRTDRAGPFFCFVFFSPFKLKRCTVVRDENQNFFLIITIGTCLGVEIQYM